MSKIRQKASDARRLGRVYSAYHKIIERLPATYPRAALVVHINLEELCNYYLDSEGVEEEEEEYLPFAFCDGNTYTVHVPLTLNEETLSDIAWYCLHEIGHLYAHHRYGESDSRWDHHATAERYANRFAGRWLKKLKEEGLFR